MNRYLTSISPDSFSGIIFALEGISRSIVLLNGPTGCKFYHASVSDIQAIRQTEFDPLNYPKRWYFGQPCVPCTFLDSDDYIYGGKDKLEEALEYMRDNAPFDLMCIVNSPGAALIGDDLTGIARRIITDRPVVTVETPGFSSDVCTGYETGVLELLKQLSLRHGDEIMPLTVNILGLSLFHRNCTGDIIELRRLMELCGITVTCILCAGCSVENIQHLPDAALNVVIHPEYGLKTAQYLKERFGTPYYIGDGPPIGFAATETFIRDVCDALGADISCFTEDCERARARAYPFISRVNSLTGLPKGVHFAVEGTYSELYSYTSFLVHYFGMIPECTNVVCPDSDSFRERLYGLYDELGVSEALGCDILETTSDLVFATGNTIAGLKLRRHVFTGIETGLPSFGYVDVIPKTHLGVRGALLIVEQVLNGMVY